MNFVINPYIGIGEIKLGMTRSEVRSTLKSRFESCQRTGDLDIPEDFFPELGIFVEYNQSDVCASIQVVTPLDPIWRGKKLLQMPFIELAEWFISIDPDIELDETGFTCYKYGIGTYAPDYQEEPDSSPESIIVFTRGYYDQS
jgi:hypothetical protein